ncbi:MAG TPA: hypothetical protein VGO40_19080, partial [Longimicrobium sp.]|nr:hypothetical protein [Longimicrobium sp.]
IGVEPDPEDPDTLRLVHAPTGRRVVPVDLGFLNPRMRPPLYQLVSRFTPPAMFGPPIPESPEPRRPRAAAPEEPAAEAVDADTVAVGGGDADTAGAAPAVDADTAVADTARAAADGIEIPPAEPPPPPRILARPRVTFEGSLVLARRRWVVPGELFPQREPHEAAADFFVRANRWRREAGIPETSYVRINPLPEPPAAKPGEPAGAQAEADAAAEAQAAAAAAGEVPGYEAPVPEQAEEEHEEPAAAAEGAAGEAAEGAEGAEKTPAKPRTPGSRDLHKPQFIDFGNPLLVGLMGKMGANLKGWQAIVEERLPAREGLPRHEGKAYATELVVQLYYPAGTASPVPAATGEEDHAAAVA